MEILIVGIVAFSNNRHLARLRSHIKQAPDLADPFASDAVGEEAGVADAVEAGGQDVDQETADELLRRQAHDFNPVAALDDPVVFPPKGHGVGVRADKAVV